MKKLAFFFILLVAAGFTELPSEMPQGFPSTSTQAESSSKIPSHLYCAYTDNDTVT